MLTLLLFTSLTAQANALEYTIHAPKDYLFSASTSVETIHTQQEPANRDRSKNVSLVPPGFGSPTSYLPGSGTYLTPNLVPGALHGGLVTQTGTNQYTPIVGVDGSGGVYATEAPIPEIAPLPDGIAVSWSPNESGAVHYNSPSFTEVSSDLYDNSGSLGTLKIPALGLNVRIFEGTDNATLAKGAGHFKDTSIWNGNVCIAGHNRGANCYFGNIHTLKQGNEITLTTKLGTRTYAVTSVKKITETDNSDTEATWENCITLFTCVRNQSEFRWSVRAVEIS